VITDLVKQDGRVAGAIGFPVTGLDFYVFQAKAVVVSTGGWELKAPGSDNHNMTGDGQAVSFRAGADLSGKSTFYAQAAYAAYPSWRGGRAARSVFRYYTDAEGARVAHGYESDIGLDIAFHDGRGPMYHDLDAATPEDVERMWKRQENSDAMESNRVGFDPRKGGKFLLCGGNTGTSIGGGLWPINRKCATTIPGLYAAGDSCDHKARWWGGLVPGAVTGTRAGLGAAEYASRIEKPSIDREHLNRLKKRMYGPIERKSGFDPRWVTQLLLGTMAPYYVLIIKREDRLQAALTMVNFFSEHYVSKLRAADSHELRLCHETANLVLGAQIVLKTCLFRTESRRMNYREDYPRRVDPDWLAWIRIRNEDGEIKLSKVPIPDKWWPDLSRPYEERYPVRFPGEERKGSAS
jgi:succinate dehydrogenase/fumarate reductase flavoprotein subunit